MQQTENKGEKEDAKGVAQSPAQFSAKSPPNHKRGSTGNLVIKQVSLVGA